MLTDISSNLNRRNAIWMMTLIVRAASGWVDQERRLSETRRSIIIDGQTSVHRTVAARSLAHGLFRPNTQTQIMGDVPLPKLPGCSFVDPRVRSWISRRCMRTTVTGAYAHRLFCFACVCPPLFDVALLPQGCACGISYMWIIFSCAVLVICLRLLGTCICAQEMLYSFLC